MSSSENNSDKINNFIYQPNQYLFLELLALVSLFLIIYKWHPFDLADRFPAMINLFWIIVIFLLTVSYLFIKQRSMDKSLEYLTLSELFIKAFATIGGIFTILAVILLFLWLIYKFPSAYTAIITVINILIFAGLGGAIYLLYRQFNPASKSAKNKNDTNDDTKPTSLKFFIQLILYIPCLFIDVIEFFKHQWKITTRTIWIILGLEILLITLRFLIPYLFKKIINLTTKNGTKLLKEPIYLNNEKTLGGFKKEPEESELSQNDIKHNYRYAISSWFYINPQPPNTSKAYTKYTNILNYGNKPRIQFNSLKNTLRIQTELNNHKFITIYKKKNIDYQKWHNIVINYDGGTMDIFLDGELVSSKPKIIPYMSHENIIAGSNNGIHGGICNVIYYDRLLTKNNIILNYKLLRDRHFPVL